jgi:NAD(P)H-dependent FMN reductase
MEIVAIANTIVMTMSSFGPYRPAAKRLVPKRHQERRAANQPAMVMPILRVGVIVGSNRPIRICRDISEWVLGVAQTVDENSYELIDLAEVNLPFLDEPEMAAAGNYQHEHTKHWSALIQSFDAFVFVVPQYNWGYPAVVKNALDFLYAEWRDKPVAVVSYGTRGGRRATEQLHVVFQGLHMRVVDENPALITNAESVDQTGKLHPAATLFASFEPDVRKMATAIAQLRADGGNS